MTPESLIVKHVVADSDEKLLFVEDPYLACAPAGSDKAMLFIKIMLIESSN
jgi:hypothetical protein